MAPPRTSKDPRSVRINGFPVLAMTPTFRARTLAKIDRSGGRDACWPWTGGTDKHRRGRIRTGRANLALYSNQAAWFVFRGALRTGKQVNHVGWCALGANCCNFRHLYEGDQLQNVADREAVKKRAA